MKKLLQINVCSNILSTGKICEDIANVAQNTGWETYIAYNCNAMPSVSNEIKVGSKLNKAIHCFQYKLFDNEGLCSKRQTYFLLGKIKEINPDIIHLHNIHDHWLNYPLLFDFIAKHKIPVVWTQHDCWSFTGGCMYFDINKCEKWKENCIACTEYRGLLVKNQSERNFKLKKLHLSKIQCLTFVPVSDWLREIMKESIQKDRKIITIHNGIDISKFKPLPQLSKSRKFKILGVAAVWDARKGLGDFVKLHRVLSGKFEITIVGLTERQIKSLPPGMIGITRTSNVEELVQLYSDADVYVNLTYSDNFPTTNIEALACGTPVITYNTGGSPEAIDETTGYVVEQGDINTLVATIKKMKDDPLSSGACRMRAEKLFDKDKCFEQYITLYNELIE